MAGKNCRLCPPQFHLTSPLGAIPVNCSMEFCLYACSPIVKIAYASHVGTQNRRMTVGRTNRQTDGHTGHPKLIHASIADASCA